MKHIPQRKCICCNKTKNKNELIRIAMLDSSQCVIDRNKTCKGRGAYICNNEQCFEILIKKNALSRAFRTKITQTAHENLREELSN